jgi:hypothetical protein
VTKNRKSVARFENIDKTIDRVVSQALYDKDKLEKLREGRKSLTISQHLDIFHEDTKRFDETKEGLIKGTGQFRDWSDNLRFRTFSHLIGVAEALSAGLTFTESKDYDPFTGEPDDDDEQEQEDEYDQEETSYDDTEEDYDFARTDREPATTRIEYTGDIY